MDLSELLEEAEEHIRRSRFDQAIGIFRTLLAESPEDAELRAKLADAYRRTGNAERAFHHFKRAADLHAHKSERRNALRMLQEANGLLPNEPEIVFRIAEYTQELGMRTEFESSLRQLVSVARAKGDRRRMWALEHLHRLRPEDGAVERQYAETLGEAGRLDEAVRAYTSMSGRLDPSSDDFVGVLLRAAQICAERPDLGGQLAGVLLLGKRPREALSLLVPYYERYPDDVGILAALLSALEGIGARHKLVAARVELLKARARHGQYAETMRDIETLLTMAPDEPAALEVCAHACAVFNESKRAAHLWRQTASVCERKGLRLERDRAILALLKTNPDDEGALELGARALEEAGRRDEAATLRQRLAEIRNARAKEDSPIEIDVDMDLDECVDDDMPEDARDVTGTMVLDEADVVDEQPEITDPDASPADDPLPIMVSPWADSDEDDFDEDDPTSQSLTPIPLGTATSSDMTSSPAAEAKRRRTTGAVFIDPSEFTGVEDEAGPDDLTTIAPAERRGSTQAGDQTLERSPTTTAPMTQALAPSRRNSTDAAWIDDISVNQPQGEIHDPFFREADSAAGAVEQPEGADEVTSKMEALVAEEFLRREQSSAVDDTDDSANPRRSFTGDRERVIDEPLVADLLADTDRPPRGSKSD